MPHVRTGVGEACSDHDDTSRRHACRPNTELSWTGFDPELPFKIDPMNGREDAEKAVFGLRRGLLPVFPRLRRPHGFTYSPTMPGQASSSVLASRRSGIESLLEPAVRFTEHPLGFGSPALFNPKPRAACRRTQFK